ncbi:MAG: hypothetical protein IJC76_01245 [Lachnospiraceae bacterium]|nr:hypothetical protein [Lachnospiraceae bacterium]
MKKLFIFLFIITTSIGMSACKGSSSANENKKILTEGDWEYFNAYIGETEGITFNKEGEYFYCCSCGEPVGDSDLYDTYSYDGKKTITLKASYDDGPKDILVNILYMDDKTLLLDMGDDIVEFYNANNSTNCVCAGETDNCDDCIAYLDGYDAYSTILSITNEDIEIVPAGYDGDTADLFEDYKRIVQLSDDVKFYSLFADSTFKDDERVSHDCTYTELTQKDVTVMLEDSSGSALIWYNKDGQITKMIFYGTTAVYE